jgi:hypothetical protein
VPYFYIPDGLMEDPLMLETIMGKMRLSLPNLILHFSAIQLPVESWNHCWNYDRGGDGIVDEDELPFPIPTGTSRDSKYVFFPPFFGFAAWRIGWHDAFVVARALSLSPLSLSLSLSLCGLMRNVDRLHKVHKVTQFVSLFLCA